MALILSFSLRSGLESMLSAKAVMRCYMPAVGLGRVMVMEPAMT
jgi:hypothetical protein